MDAVHNLTSLFPDLSDSLWREYGTRVVLVSDPTTLYLRVRSTRKGDDDSPRFRLTIRVGRKSFDVAYRPTGRPEGKPETKAVRIDEADVKEKLFKLVMKYVAAERKRLIEYRQG